MTDSTPQTINYQALLAKAREEKEAADLALDQAYQAVAIAQAQKTQAKIRFDAKLKQVVQLELLTTKVTE